jgi:hypothetical protein
MIVSQIFNLPHTYSQHHEKTPFVRSKLSNSSHGSRTWFKVIGITCEINTTNFINVKNHFKFVVEYFHF